MVSRVLGGLPQHWRQPLRTELASDPPGRGGEVDGGGHGRVLVPYCGGRVAQAALDVAASWALSHAADACVLYVRPCDLSRGGYYYVETVADAMAVAEAGAIRLRARGVTTCSRVVDSDRRLLSAAIVNYAACTEARVVVLGTRARGLLHATLVGSTSWQVARRADRPVILVNAGREAHRPRPARPGWPLGPGWLQQPGAPDDW
ncbi:universal stress protein [Nocardioides guangzhouensis]|nr:universal stress protein [Nocardioides guangzhouensis]